MARRKGGFPHSEICGSKGARASPHLIAACHVLHSLSMPRHPSEALSRLIILTQKGARTRRPIPRRRTRCARLGFDMGGIIRPNPRRLVRRCLHSRSALKALETPGQTLPSQCHLVTHAAHEAPRTCSLIDHERVQPPRSCLPAPAGWWSQTGSNRRPHACKARALPTELWPQRDASQRELRVADDLVGVRRLGNASPRMRGGGPRRTRTADLTLIRRVL